MIKQIIVYSTWLLALFSPAFAKEEAAHPSAPVEHVEPMREEELAPIETMEPKVEPEAEKIGLAGELTSLFTTLALFITVLVLAAWLIKKMLQSKIQQMNESAAIKLIERRALSPKTTLHLINVQGKGFLLAESPAGITKIGDFDLS
ncbi:MAG: hypothetical protein K0S07_1488 [Chlamydiales bacterium]|jgi:flagellar biosynthetic protein FliO|nr:hypothetical protein [Chlamydiales bacterium]